MSRHADKPLGILGRGKSARPRSRTHGSGTRRANDAAPPTGRVCAARRESRIVHGNQSIGSEIKRRSKRFFEVAVAPGSDHTQANSEAMGRLLHFTHVLCAPRITLAHEKGDSRK